MKADLNLCWMNMSEGTFSEVAAQMFFLLVGLHGNVLLFNPCPAE